MRNKKLETCIVCDGSTCRSGKGDDSLYCPVCKEGPYCDACYYDHCLECYEKDSKNKDSTIATLKAEKAQKQLVINACKRNLKERDTAIARLKRELEEARGMCDLYVDEFHRIIAIADNSEIEQRDNLEAENAALREEVAEVKKRYQLSVYAEETERKARVDMTSDNAALRARVVQAEGKVERVRAWVDINEKTFPNGILCFAERIREILE